MDLKYWTEGDSALKFTFYYNSGMVRPTGQGTATGKIFCYGWVGVSSSCSMDQKSLKHGGMNGAIWCCRPSVSVSARISRPDWIQEPSDVGFDQPQEGLRATAGSNQQGATGVYEEGSAECVLQTLKSSARMGCNTVPRINRQGAIKKITITSPHRNYWPFGEQPCEKQQKSLF